MVTSKQIVSKSVSSALHDQWKYDVFLSFMDEDTCKAFTDELYDKLQEQGFKTFKHDVAELGSGTTTSAELLSKIEESRFAIIILSPKYACSTRCLDEVSTILECMDETAILPVFYDVDHYHVQKQMGPFAEPFNKHEESFKEDLAKVESWRSALTRVGNLSGWKPTDRHVTKLVKEIIETVRSKFTPAFFGHYLVGIDTRLEELDMILADEANDVQFVGIWGIGGIGKTTLARLLFERTSNNFEVSCFLANVRETSATHGLLHLQEQLLSTVLGRTYSQVWDLKTGTSMIHNYLCDKKVLLVLDDVDVVDQLDVLVGKREWFGSGSRIIISTRNRHVLAEHGIEKIYRPSVLAEQEALQLFSWNAFRREYPEEEYMIMSQFLAVNYARGFPLVLKVLASSLYKRGREEWTHTLTKLEQAPSN